MSKTGKFFLAGILGAVAGAVGGLLLAPQSGKKTRQEIADLAEELALRVKTKADDTRNLVVDVYGKYTEEGKAKYLEIKEAVVSKIATVKTAGENIDKEKYEKVVEDVVADFKGDLEATKDGGSKIIRYLKKDWEKIKKALA
ncbi:MAG: YtxH domain-containing protein [Candidatus Shapirobacteria bacterium]